MDIQTSEQTYQQSVVRSVSPIRTGGKDKCFSNSGLKGVSCKYTVQNQTAISLGEYLFRGES